MKRIILSLTAAVLFVLPVFVSVPVLAIDDVRFVPSSTDVNSIGGCDGDAADSPVCQDIRSTTNPLFGPNGILTKVANIFALVTGIISVFMITIGGLRYIMSAGDPGKTSSAKNAILYSAIGIAVASVAGLVARFILSRL